jgi:hypothetical protein
VSGSPLGESQQATGNMKGNRQTHLCCSSFPFLVSRLTTKRAIAHTLKAKQTIRLCFVIHGTTAFRKGSLQSAQRSGGAHYDS